MRSVFTGMGLALAALTMVSCGGFNKLLKSTNPERKYNKALEYFHKGKYVKSAILLQDVMPSFGGTSKGDTIAYYYGASLFKQEDFESSGEIFDEFRHYYGRSPFLEDAEYMYAKGVYFTSPRTERDQGNTMRAIAAISEYLGRHPESSRQKELEANLDELRRKLYDKAMISSRLYYDIGYYNSAVTALKNAIALYPESNHRELLSYLIVRSHYMYARNSVETKQRQRYLDMQDAYYSFVAEYPDSKYKGEVEKMLADSKKYLVRFAEKGDAAPPPADSVQLSVQQQRQLKREEDKKLKQEDKELSSIDDKIKQQGDAEKKARRKANRKKNQENTEESEHGN